MDNHSPPRRIAIFRAIFLGDLLCSLPAFRALRLAYPEAEITLIGLPWAREFVERVPYLDHFEEFCGHPGIMEVPYDAAHAAAGLARARAADYDVAIQMHGNGHISNGFVASLGARLSLGFCTGLDKRLDITLRFDHGTHEVWRCLHLVELLGIPVEAGPIEFPIAGSEDMEAAALLADMDWNTAGPLVGLHPGAKVAGRRWPPARFAEVGDTLVEQFGARIVLTGIAAERELSSAVREAMHSPVLDLAGKTSLGVFAALLGRLDLLVTNDTGASHLAAVTRTPSVVLFGLSGPEEWAPLDSVLHRVVNARSFAPRGVDLEEVLGHLPVEPVLAECANVLRQTRTARAGTSRPARGSKKESR